MAHQLIDSWSHMQNKDQATLVEAVEQLVVTSDITTSTIKILKESVDNLTSHNRLGAIHGIIFIENKLLCLYSR